MKLLPFILQAMQKLSQFPDEISNNVPVTADAFCAITIVDRDLTLRIHEDCNHKLGFVF
jgi:hypothetical protein